MDEESARSAGFCCIKNGKLSVWYYYGDLGTSGHVVRHSIDWAHYSKHNHLCCADRGFLHLYGIESFPIPKRTANDRRSAEDADHDREDALQASHICVDDKRLLLSSKDLADLRRACSQRYFWTNIREVSGKGLQQLIVERALRCCDEYSAAEGHDNYKTATLAAARATTELEDSQLMMAVIWLISAILAFTCAFWSAH